MPVVSMIRRTRSSRGSPAWRAQHSQLAGEQREPLACGRGVRRVARIVERVAQRADLGRVGALNGGRELVADRCGPLGVGVDGERARPSAEQGQVARPDRPPRAGQQGEQGGVGGEVVQQCQGGHHLGHLGQPEQALETHDLHRDVGRGQAVEHVGGMGVVPGQHPDLAPAGLGHGRVGQRHLLGQPGQLVGVRLVHDGADLALGRDLGRARARGPAGTRHTAERPARWRPPGCAGRSGGSP